MKTLLVFPFSRILRNGQPNPKNYTPFGSILQDLHVAGVHTIQCGVSTDPHIGAKEYLIDASINQIWGKALACDAFLSVDSFFPHLAHALQSEYVSKNGRTFPGVVVWNVTQHSMFGYREFINVYSKEPTFAKNPLKPMEVVAEEMKDTVISAPLPSRVTTSVLEILGLHRV